MFHCLLLLIVGRENSVWLDNEWVKDRHQFNQFSRRKKVSASFTQCGKGIYVRDQFCPNWRVINKTKIHFYFFIKIHANDRWTTRLTNNWCNYNLFYFFIWKYIFKSVYKSQSKEPKNVVSMSNCPLYTGWNYIQNSLMGKMRLPFIYCDLLYRGVL